MLLYWRQLFLQLERKMSQRRTFRTYGMRDFFMARGFTRAVMIDATLSVIDHGHEVTTASNRILA
jgi:hypothetical protein